MTGVQTCALPISDVGTIQGTLRNGAVGAIQNIGVVPEHRGQGLGRALLVQALHGFAENGMAIASLEVTAENEVAVRLYEDLGFSSRSSASHKPIARAREQKWRQRYSMPKSISDYD